MRHFSIAVDIDAPPERVWAVMTDVEHWHEWTASVREVRRLDRGPLVVGARARIRQPGFPPASWKVVAIEPGRSFVWVSRGPGFTVMARHAVVPLAAGSRATLSLQFRGLLGGVFGWLTRSVNGRYLGLEAEGLKARAEGRR